MSLRIWVLVFLAACTEAGGRADPVYNAEAGRAPDARQDGAVARTLDAGSDADVEADAKPARDAASLDASSARDGSMGPLTRTLDLDTQRWWDLWSSVDWATFPGPRADGCGSLGARCDACDPAQTLCQGNAFVCIPLGSRSSGGCNLTSCPADRPYCAGNSCLSEAQLRCICQEQGARDFFPGCQPRQYLDLLQGVRDGRNISRGGFLCESKLGGSCGGTVGCCDPNLCATSGPEQGTCRAPCFQNKDCGSQGTCSDTVVGGRYACRDRLPSDPSFDVCVKTGATCGAGVADCCEDAYCTPWDNAETCRKLCHTSGDCRPSGRCMLFSDSDAGVCF